MTKLLKQTLTPYVQLNLHYESQAGSSLTFYYDCDLFLWASHVIEHNRTSNPSNRKLIVYMVLNNFMKKNLKKVKFGNFLTVNLM